MATGALRANVEHADLVEVSDAPPAGADLDDVDDRQHDGVAAHRVTDEVAVGHLWKTVAHERGLRRGASHVEGHRLVDAQPAREPRGRDRAAHRTRFHGARRLRSRRLGRHHPTVRLHDQHSTLERPLRKDNFERLKI